MKDFIPNEIAAIRHLVGDRAQVIGAVSGGVDSTVAAKLMREAIGKFPMLFQPFSFAVEPFSLVGLVVCVQREAGIRHRPKILIWINPPRL